MIVVPDQPAAVSEEIGKGDPAPAIRLANTTQEREAVAQLTRALSLSPTVGQSQEVSRAASQLEAVTRSQLEKLNNRQTDFYPVGQKIGEFQWGNSGLVYHPSQDQTAIAVACKLLHIPEPSLLTPESVLLLAKSNTVNERVAKAFTQLAELVEQGKLKESATIQITKGEYVQCPVGLAAEIVAIREAVTIALAQQLIEKASKEPGLMNPNEQASLVAAKDGLESSKLLRDAIHLRFESSAATVTLPYQASLGKAAFTRVTPEDIQQELQPFDALAQAAVQHYQRLNQQGKNESFTSSDRDLIVTLTEQAKREYLQAHREAALATALVESSHGDLAEALGAYQAAVAYGDRHESQSSAGESSTWPAERSQIIERARSISTTVISQQAGAVTEQYLEQIEKSLAPLTPNYDAKLALAEGLSGAKATLLLQPDSSERTAQVRHLEALEARTCNELVKDLLVSPPSYSVTAQMVSEMSEPQRKAAFEALNRLMRDAFERRDSSCRLALEGAITTFIEAEPDRSLARSRLVHAVTGFASFAFEQTDVLREPSPLIQHLLKHEVNTAQERSQTIATRAMLMRFLEVELERLEHERQERVTTLAQKPADSKEHTTAMNRTHAIDREIARCITALHQGIALEVVHAPTSAQKVAAFERLQLLLEPSRKQELDSIRELKTEYELRKTALANLEQESSAESRVRKIMVKGNLATLEASLAQLSNSVAQVSVSLAKTALEAHDPELTKRAKSLIDALPPEALNIPGGGNLIKAFRSSHESPNNLLAAVKQFLHESVRDKPEQTYALMIALGILGGAGAYMTRRAPHLGFLLASSATLGATKAYCIATGVESVMAAHATGLTLSTNGTAALDLFYLASDIAQAGLLYGAFSALRKSERLGYTLTLPASHELLRVIGSEVVQYAKAALSQLDPRNLGFYLIGIPLTVGAYYIHASGARPEEQTAQALQLAREVLPILTIAILHDRIRARLEQAKKESGLKAADSSPPDEEAA